MQQPDKILPKFINTDVAYDELLPDESPYIKNLEDSINQNPDSNSNNPTKQGQNAVILTPVHSNLKLPDAIAPAGQNKNIGTFQSIETQEMYYLNFNSNLNHGIYVVDGNSGVWSTVIIDPKLEFSDDPAAFIAEHRVCLRLVFDKYKNIVEKFILWTDGQKWQGWVAVKTAIATNGFDVSLYPYFTLLPPHFDRKELLEWAIRKPMYNPVVTPLTNSASDLGKVNRLIDTAFQFAASWNNTDGRRTELGSYSLPLIVNTSDFLNNPDNLPKNARVTIYAGSCMTESIDLYVRTNEKQVAGVPSENSWSPWKFYDRIYKFGPDANVLGTQYWLRTNPWAGLAYDPIFNTIGYTFDNSKAGLIPTIDTTVLQNDLPQLSVGHTPMGDAEALANNRYGYNNATKEQLENIDVQVIEKEQNVCTKPLRKIRLYGYTGRPGDTFSYVSQVGYFLGDDKQMRFGGTTTGRNDRIGVDAQESKFFSLDFADKNAFRCYLKGTPYFADGTWYYVNSDNSLVKLDNLLDFNSADVQEFVQRIFVAGGYFVCVFDLLVPSDRYTACIGRHNVSSAGDYRNTSSYVYGIANSRVKSQTTLPAVNGGVTVTSIKPNAIGSFSKEMEVDATAGDVDVWGNNHDLFYIYCPDYEHASGAGHFRFIEGYLKESGDNPLPVELFPYMMTKGNTDDSGQFTDKNGFYWAKTKAHDSDSTDIIFTAKINCAYPTQFVVPTSQGGDGWKVNANAYLSDNNLGVVGDCNRILVRGTITNLDGTLRYSNVAISIVDGSVTNSRSDGTFELVVHNGMATLRSSNIYINAGGNFQITIAGCGQVPLSHFNEALAPCVNCNERVYPVLINLAVNAEGFTQMSVKENSTYSIGGALADLAGRLTYVSPVKELTVPSFLQRGDVLATYFRMLINGPMKFDPDLKWFAPYVSNQLNILKYIQWVGDKIRYIDSNGNVVTDPASAVFCAIYIDSLYNYNVANNFSLLANYQFTPQDRMRILDDGNGHLFDVATYGDPIDLQVLGTNYNQAAMTAGIVPNTQNPVVNVNTITTPTQSITLFVRYDARLDKIINNTGFWIELYTPTQLANEIPFNEMEWKPVINGEVADFTGYQNGRPVYTYPTFININFWDTYFFNRNISIPGAGDKFLNHPFESPNISDSWGYHITSGGRQNVRNENAKQQWFRDDVIKSDNMLVNGIVNGLGTFKSINRKDFSQYKWGGIVGMMTQRSVVLFICENDFFTTNFDFHFAYANAQGVMVTNLDQGLSEPFQKIGDNFGCAYEYTGSILSHDKIVWWYDINNAALVICDYKSARDVSEIKDDKGRMYGVKSYFIAKSQFIGDWNKNHDVQSRFDVFTGVDMVRKNLYVTFRPRRKNSNSLSSYVNQMRAFRLDYQETVVYNIDSGRWTKATGFTPEAYGKLKGSKSGVEMFAFAAGVPYLHNNVDNDSFLEFFGQATEPVFSFMINKNKEIVKILENLALDSTVKWFFDLICDTQDNSYSYVPLSYVKEKEKLLYAPALRDMVSYLDPKEAYRSTLVDGKRIFGAWVFVRMVGDPNRPTEYRQLSDAYYVVTNSPSTNKK
jgi:hypothetical protein